MPTPLQIGLACLLGALCLVIGWLLRRPAPAAADVRLVTQLRAQLAEAGNARAAAEAKQGSAEHLLAEQKQIYERSLTEARQAQDKALTDLREAFKALSAEALKQTAPEFLRLAEQSLGKF